MSKNTKKRTLRKKPYIPNILHHLSLKTPITGELMSDNDSLDCASSMCKGVSNEHMQIYSHSNNETPYMYEYNKQQRDGNIFINGNDNGIPFQMKKRVHWPTTSNINMFPTKVASMPLLLNPTHKSISKRTLTPYYTIHRQIRPSKTKRKTRKPRKLRKPRKTLK